MKEIRCPIVWHTQAAFLGFVESSDTRLGVTITGKPGEWEMSAIQTSATGVTGILADHSHEYLGAFKDFEKARRVGTLYAKKWLEGKLRAKKKCECEPIRKGRR
jgi:hypothetical protein